MPVRSICIGGSSTDMRNLDNISIAIEIALLFLYGIVMITSVIVATNRN